MSRLIAVRDAVAESVGAALGPDGGAVAVLGRRWRADLPLDLPATGVRRVVFVTAPDWARAETEDRTFDAFDYTVFLSVAEPLPVGLATADEDAWIDERVGWFEGLAKSLGDPRAATRPAPIAALGDVWCQEQELVEACDGEAANAGLFWCVARFVFREIPGG